MEREPEYRFQVLKKQKVDSSSLLVAKGASEAERPLYSVTKSSLAVGPFSLPSCHSFLSLLQ